MKKALCLLLAFALLLTGCTRTPAQTSTPTTRPLETTHPDTVPTTEPVDAEVLYLRENLPLMDGSTSLIPLEAGIRAALYGKSIAEATADVSHSTTWQSFYNLLEGKVDLIFSCPLSAEQYALAEEAGVELETVPVAMEGFVFVVNAQNPVDTLTQEQLKGIYSGQITNWSQLGGLDEEIIPYQRNSDSGSQNFMAAFMGDSPLMDAPTEMRPASMSGLMDVIAVNDNSRAAIGYSVYAYAANMYGNGNEIKFIQVDGVAPSKETFASGDYPLMGYNYAIFHSDAPADSPVRRLVAWMQTPQGLNAIIGAGYVAVEDIGYDYQEASLRKYEGTGAGPAAETATYEYMIGSIVHQTYGDSFRDYLKLKLVKLEDGTVSYHVTQLADAALQDEINAFIDEQMVCLGSKLPQVEQLVSTMNQRYDYEAYIPEPVWPLSDSWSKDGGAACLVRCTNGYLSVVVTLSYSHVAMASTCHPYLTQTATWDLLTGRRLETEELFFQGVDIDQVLNDYLRRKSMDTLDAYGSYHPVKQDFAGLPESGWHLTPEAIYFDYDNPYFTQGVYIPLEDLPDGVLVTDQPRDCADCFAGEDVKQVRRFRTTERDFYYAYNADELVQCAYLKEEVHPNAAAINQAVMDYLNDHYTEAAIREYYDAIGLDGQGMELYWMDWWTANLGGKYLVFMGSQPEYFIESEDRYETYPYTACLIYELETGKALQWQDLLLDGWQAAATFKPSDGGSIQAAPDCDAMTFLWLRQLDEGELYICLTDDAGSYFLSVPSEYIRY